MDKQKRIEEMAKIILEASCKGSECENCEFVKRVEEAKRTCLCLKALYNAGYRKIPENAVVLTSEELDKKLEPFRLEIITLSQELVETSQKLMKARKETVEKFERLANDRIAKEQGKRYGYEASMIDDKSSYDGDIVSLALFEICKELTEGE